MEANGWVKRPCGWGAQIFGGTVRIFLAEAIFFPTGLITAAFLTRQLGLEGYGLFTLVATIVAWVEWCTSSVFFRTTIKFISEAKDWQPIGARVLQQHVFLGGGATIVLCLLAIPIAQWMQEPSLAPLIWLFAPQILLFNAARAHRTILIGLGKFSQQAIAGASRWIVRLVCIVVLVALGFSISGAILGSVAASLVELVISRLAVRPPLLHPVAFPVRQLWNHAVPMSLYALSVQLYSKLDLILLKALGGTAEQAGLYGAAQNLALFPSVFAIAFAPVLLSTLGRMCQEGWLEQAKTLGQNAMRLVLLLLPLAAMTAGAAPAIVRVVFGEPFLPTAPLLALLIFAALAQVMLSVATALLTAADKPNWPFAITGPLIPLACLGHVWLIPQFSAIGAALVTTLVTCLGAVASIVAVYHLWHILPPVATCCRTVLVTGLIYGLFAYWPIANFWLFVQLPAMALVIAIMYLLLGEFTPGEMALMRTWIRLPRLH